MATVAEQTGEHGLRRDAIGLREVLFQSITDMAPGAAIAASIPAGVAFAGGSLPLSVVFALIACLFCASSIGMLAREMPSAGSLATYAAQGLHPAIGFLVAWGYVLVGFLIPPLVLLQLGFSTLLHIVIPVLGIVTFVPAWLTAAGIDVFPFIAPLAPPYSYMGPGVAGFMVVGVIYLVYLYRREPRRVVEVGLVHLDPLEEYQP